MTTHTITARQAYDLLRAIHLLHHQEIGGADFYQEVGVMLADAGFIFLDEQSFLRRIGATDEELPEFVPLSVMAPFCPTLDEQIRFPG